MAKKINAKKLNKIIEDKMKLVEDSPAKFVSAVDKEQEKLLKEVLKLVGQLDTDSGKIKITDKNLDLVVDIDKKLKKYFYKSDYVLLVDELVNEMDKVKKLTDEYFKYEFEKPESKEANLVYASKRREAVDVFLGTSATDEAIFKPIKNNILTAVQSGSSYSELFETIQKTVTGDEKTDGKLKKYTGQITNDVFSITQRSYTKLLAETLDVQFYRYIGGTLPDTRCFCDERNNNYYHYEEIVSWGRGENIGGGCGYPWQGMILGTNESTIMNYLGGYNCQHSIIPVSLISVPKKYIIRAIDKGFFKPTSVEKTLLGLE